MFGKLLKHEFRATAPLVLLVWLGLVVFSGLSLLFRLLCELIDVFVLPMAITTTFFGLLAVASIVIVYVIIIRRFYVNVYGDEGYLTLTLPVKRGSIITSKLICGVIWVIGTVVVLGVSVLLQFATDFGTLSGTLYYVFAFISEMIRFAGMPTLLAVIEMIIYLLVSLNVTILVFYAAISIGQFFTGHRLLGSVLGYFCVSVVLKVISTAYSLIMGISGQTLGLMQMIYSGQMPDVMTRMGIHISLIVWIILNVLFAAVLWLFTDVIMRKAVNLQ